jgi:cholesterol oxidase
MTSPAMSGPAMTGAAGTAAAEQADAVVIGSGFGGAVAAYRLAQAGLSVILLERGGAYPPHSFPRTPAEMSRAFWDPARGRYGMFNVWRFSHCDSVVSSGLGGGSLINANVLMRKDEHWFVQDDPLPRGGYESWPVTRADLDPHYDEVERMLGATPYPLDADPYAATPKTRAMRDAAAELGLPWQLPPLAVSFAPAPGSAPGPGLPIVDPGYGNLHGRQRTTCRLCGECNIGCNAGAKNSLDHTYLSAARHHGADLRTGHEVRAIRPRAAGGYDVDYIRHAPVDGTGPADAAARRSGTIACGRLVLAAGTYGTSYLLLRNRASFPGLSAALGTRFSGNGDVMSFLVRTRDRRRHRPLDGSYGPVITSAMRLGDDHDGAAGHGRGGYIEDGGYPAFIDWLLEAADVPGNSRRIGRFLAGRILAAAVQAPDAGLARRVSGLIGADTLSASFLPLLGMGRDVPDGVLRLRGDRLDLAWPAASSEPYFERVATTMRRIAGVLGGRVIASPMGLRKRIVTVHPVGGAPMGRHPAVGVCDPYGEVFGYPGLYVADGAAMPGPVGVNPSLTIAALADRMCTRLLDRRPASMARGTAAVRTGSGAGPGSGPAPRDPASIALSFTEEMSGVCAPGGGPAARAHPRQEPLAVRLTITADDVDGFLADPGHCARAEGWVDAASLGGRCQVQRGWFSLFGPDGAPDRGLLRYRLQFADAAGQPRTLLGWKNVWPGAPARIWPETSTLYVRLLAGHIGADEDDEAAATLATGVLHLRLADFVRQLATIRVDGPHRAAGLERFGRFFAGQLWDVYGPGRGHA